MTVLPQLNCDFGIYMTFYHVFMRNMSIDTVKIKSNYVEHHCTLTNKQCPIVLNTFLALKYNIGQCVLDLPCCPGMSLDSVCNGCILFLSLDAQKTPWAMPVEH